MRPSFKKSCAPQPGGGAGRYGEGRKTSSRSTPEQTSEAGRNCSITQLAGRPAYSAVIFTCWAFAVPDLGNSILRTPFVIVALIFDASTPAGSAIARSKEP